MAKAHQPLSPSTAPDNHRLTADQAASAILSLINSQPRSPDRADIAAIIAQAVAPSLVVKEVREPGDSELHRKIREAITRIDEAEQVCLSFDGTDANATRQYDERKEELSELEAQISNPPLSFEDVIARAQIAYRGADKEVDNETMVPHDEDCFEGPAVRLIEAVLQLGGCYHA